MSVCVFRNHIGVLSEFIKHTQNDIYREEVILSKKNISAMYIGVVIRRHTHAGKQPASSPASTHTRETHSDQCRTRRPCSSVDD